MKYRLDLDWHEEQYIFLRFGVDASTGVTVEVPDELVARREAAWKELDECDRQLRALYQEQLKAERAIEDAKDEAEWKAGAAQHEADRLERNRWDELKRHFKGEIRLAQGEKGVLDETDIGLLLHGLAVNSRERNLMKSLIANARRMEQNFAICGKTPEAVAIREQRKQKRLAALQESITKDDKGV